MRSPRRCSAATSDSSTRVVGDTVNLAQRLQDLARPAGMTVLSEATRQAAGDAVDVDTLGDRLVKGRETPVTVHRLVAVADLVGESSGPGDMSGCEQ